MKRALVTGITGQDGSYLAEILLEKGYEVHGLGRRVASENQTTRFSRIDHLLSKIHLHYGDIADYPTLWKLIAEITPDEVYHLAAQSQVAVSFEDEFGTLKANALSTSYLLSAIRSLKPDCRFYFAATSEMFGGAKVTPQDERTPFDPVSPYAISKVASFFTTKMYREGYGIHACSGILFNHESPRRGFEFVTRKITTTAARIKLGLDKELRLGNLDTKRDWGFAGDYVKAMWLMLQAEKADDYVVGTGESHTVKEFVEATFEALDLDWQEYIIIDKKLFRPTDPVDLRADASKARSVLGWAPTIKFKELVRIMVENDLHLLNARTRTHESHSVG